MALIKRSSRRFKPRTNDYTLPERRTGHRRAARFSLVSGNTRSDETSSK